MDQQDGAQLGGFKPLEAERNLIDLDAQPNHEAWPHTSSRNQSQTSRLTESVRSMSIHSSTAPASKRRAGGVSVGAGQVYTESYPYLSSPPAASVCDEDDDDTASETTTTPARKIGSTGAWGTSQTSRALFPTAKPTPKAQPKAGDWEGILRQQDEETKSNMSGNMATIAWWDPTSKDYDISRFLHPVLGNYYCPFPACEDALLGNSFDSQGDIESHIKYCHTRTRYRCAECFKHFQNASSLVAHAESTRRCGIRGSGKFEKVCTCRFSLFLFRLTALLVSQRDYWRLSQVKVRR